MYDSITPELIADLWERPLREDAAIGYSPEPTRRGYYVAPGRFIAHAHVVISQDVLHGRTATGTVGSPSLWESMAKDIDAEEPARCEVCGSKSTTPQGWPCEDCGDEMAAPRGHGQNPDDRNRVMDR